MAAFGLAGYGVWGRDYGLRFRVEDFAPGLWV